LHLLGKGTVTSKVTVPSFLAGILHRGEFCKGKRPGEAAPTVSMGLIDGIKSGRVSSSALLFSELVHQGVLGRVGGPAEVGVVVAVLAAGALVFVAAPAAAPPTVIIT
jgi:hypothetical protein